MASADKSLDAPNFDDSHASDPSSSCLNDPNYAIICVFLQKFGGQLKIEHPNFLRLQKMIENTDEVHDELKQFFVKLLRKTRKSVQPDKLDSALAKFCYTYSAQDAWEVERFGYKKASLAVKLRILKEVLESQFDKNPNFRTLISSQTATELRSQPLGKDKLGNAYWSTIDDQCNLRVYQEHLDEEIWKVVATNREEMVKLISCLRCNELVMPSLIGLIDEDSSSNSMPPKVDALQNENGTSNGTTNGNDSDDKNVPCLKIKLNPGGGESTVEQISNGDSANGAKTQSQNDSVGDEEEEEDASIMSETQSLAASESSTTTAGTKSNETHGSKRISLMASKPPSNANKLKLRIFATDKKTMKRNLEEDSDTASGRSKRPSMKKSTDDDDSEFESDDLSDEELDENDMSGEDEVGPAIEEPTMYVHGSGSGAVNKSENILWSDCDSFDENEVSEAIEEEIFFVHGEGNGYDCDVGNNDTKTTESPPASNTPAPQPVVQSKPMFFFGQAGCLKLSPMKPTVSTENSAVSTSDNATETIENNKVESEKLENEKIESEKMESEKLDCEKVQSENNQESSSFNESITNDTNSVALDLAKSEIDTIEENVTSNDETDRGISIVNESTASDDTSPNNGDEKAKQTTSSIDSQTNETTKQIDMNDSSIVKDVEQVSDSEMPAGIATNIGAESDSSKDNIESNSSVALASISVQEDNKSVEQESFPIESELNVAIESHSTNVEMKNNEISENCVERQSPTPEPHNEVKDMEKIDDLDEKEDEDKPIETSEILNESNENVKIENQSSLSVENKPNDGVEQISASAVDVVPIENQTLDSSENADICEQTNEANEVKDSTMPEESEMKASAEPDYSGQEPVVEEIIVPKKAYICGPEGQPTVCLTRDDLPATDVGLSPQTEQPTEQHLEGEPSKIMDNKSNDEEKTESLSEQVLNEPIAIEQNIKCGSPIEESTIEKTEEIIPAKTHTETSQSIPTECVESKPTEEKPKVEPESISSASIESDQVTSETNDTTEPTEAIQQLETVCPPEILETIENDNKDIGLAVALDQETQQESVEVLQSTSQDPLAKSDDIQSEAVKRELSPALVIEKRKSVDEVEPPSESKKICEENIAIEAYQSAKIEVTSTLEQVSTEITISQPEDVPEPEPSDFAKQSSAIEIENKPIETLKSQEDAPQSSNSTVMAEKMENDTKNEQSSLEVSAKICDESLNDEQIELPVKPEQLEQPEQNKKIIPTETNVSNISKVVAAAGEDIKNIATEKEPLAIDSGSTKKEEQDAFSQGKINNSVTKDEQIEVKPTVDTPAPLMSNDIFKSNLKEPTSPPPTAEISRSAQLRNRKRRISTEKARHSSESDDNNDALIESPLSQDSSDEAVGGKRPKMRPKVVKRSMRKSVEQKRNIKDTEWSSDENDKPNAKRATSELSKDARNIASSVEKVVLQEDTKPKIKEERILPDTKEENKVKDDEQAEQLSDEEEKATPTRRPGRPARRGRKPGPKPKAKATQEIKSEEVKEEKPEPENLEQTDSVKEETVEAVSVSVSTPIKPETRRKKRSLLGLDMAEVETIQANDADAPVRQSRRIAQIKIKEEAERRKAEEVALQKMKEASEKRKKGVVQKPSESEEENSESEAKLEKKKPRKKGNKDRPWQTDSDDSSDREEEDVYEHEDVERLPPLRSDHEFSPESDIEDESQIVPTKRARTARKDKTERREESSEEEEDIHACQKCGKSDHPEWILLCDKCDKGYHCSCLIPVLFVIPEGNWFCPPCQQEKLIDELEARLVEFDSLVKQREVEEAQRQRLLLTTISEANVISDSKRDRQRARAADFDESEDSDSDGSSSEESGNELKESKRERRTRPRPRPSRQRNLSESSEQSSSDNTSDNEPIYKLRKRRQANVSYRFNEYDELINRAIKSEMDEVAGAGNLGRGKDISTIMEADKEEKRLKKLEQQQKERELTGDTNEKDDDSDNQPLKIKADKSDDSDSEPIRPKAIKRSKSLGKKKKKLNSLDIDSEEDVDSSDDDFKGDDSYSDEEEDDSTPDSESSLESIVKRKDKGRGILTRRSNRERKKRYDADFIDDSSFDDEDNVPLFKKKKKTESDFSDFDGSSEELEEDVDSDDLCDDSTDESDRSWGKRKPKKPASKGKEIKTIKKKKPDGESAFKGKTSKKKPKVSDDESDDDDADEVLPKSRRTRGKKLPYLLDDDFDSSDDGIKPGVKRPDTPPEEREAFIKKQEEIKRMLAEKRDESVDKIPPPVKGSLSTIPPQIIQTAKALDVDLKKTAILNRNASDNDSNGFDDDLPEDFDPEDMDEDAIAKMMEEEEFAQQQLKLAGETIRNRKLKDALSEPMKKDESPTKLTIETGPSVIIPPNVPPSLVSPLPLSASQLTIPDIPPSMYTAQFQAAHSKISTTTTTTTTTPKKRGRKTKDDIPHVIAKDPTQPQPQPQIRPPQTQTQPQPPLSTIQHTSVIPPPQPPIKPNTLMNIQSVLQQTSPSQLFSSPTIQHTSSVIAHSSVIQQQPRTLPPMPPSAVSTLLGLREQIIPSTVLDVQNTRLLDPSELGKPPDDLLDAAAKKRARRKKVTPTRESLITSPPNVTVSPGITQPTLATIPNVPIVTKPPTSILSERLSANPAEKPGLSIATPPQLYSPSSRSQASVITRLARPSQRQPFPTGQSPPQRYYAPNSTVPPHTIPSTGAHSRPYHAPNVTAASGARPPPLVPPPPHTSGHLPHPMYMRGQPGIYGGYPNIQPPPMHRSLPSMEHSTNPPQNFTGPYQNLPFGSYYAAAAAAERRSGAIIGTFEPFDNKNPSSHDRLPAYAHPGLGHAALAARNSAGAEGDDERSAAPGGPAGSTSEFSGLVSYFSSQQDDLDS